MFPSVFYFRTNPWGRALKQKIGINGIDATAIRAETVNAGEYNLNGTPVLESGADSNGFYIKFAGGVLLCAVSKSFTDIRVSSEWGSLYESEALSMGSFPERFSSPPCVMTKVTNPDGNATAAGMIEGPYQYTEGFAGQVYICRPTPGNYNFKVDLFAIGAWK